MNPAQRSSVPMSRVRNILANLTLVVVSTLIGFFVIELLFFRLVLPTMPAHLRPHLSGTAGVLAQSSKAAFVPNDYIALLGDSYAEGFGDWQLSLGEDESPDSREASCRAQAERVRRALDDFTAANGATRVVPGSHLRPAGKPDAAQADPTAPSTPAPLPAAAGLV